jgi:hypothetical protein
MPGKGTRNRTIRMDLPLWTALGTRAAGAGTDRAAVLRALVRWWLRIPGAELPERPPADDPQT